MYKNCNGFTFFELLISLSVWSGVIVMIIAHWTIIMIGRENKKAETIANQILYEVMMNEQIGNETTVVRGTHTFSLFMRSNEQCVRWEDRLKRTKERCESLGQ
ncbi:type II secretion system protein [Anoxybacillus sp. LAT_35]|uniref:competence type IV pilus minor pilin ComGE n=1 Tax=Anoxybacillus TaxID=150247 RepID=UPI001EDB7969|nr:MULTISPECIES: competence type IV pilus minor pilin ComGE [Anoxybacillus]MCG5024294.1 type II secretion system protein [Anoxybacillus flavithermus]MCG6198310.1 type II secretion system protein [Anoxybacillus sp. LAT_38]MCG3085754.1 type II secretion system protein [Anoxybacillus sp. LAT27]MCG6171922.1 type II secretion system protein [Anoxybacillus sp. LAT_11]MCG6174278.1 type II secretion system protein [Anoxybacillus sp. LAT_31]